MLMLLVCKNTKKGYSTSSVLYLDEVRELKRDRWKEDDKMEAAHVMIL